MPHPLLPTLMMLHRQPDRGPVAMAVPAEIPMPPMFAMPQSQQYLRPLEPRAQGLAPPYPPPRPDDKRKRTWKGKAAQHRRWRPNNPGSRKAGLNAIPKMKKQRTRRHFQRLNETPQTLHGDAGGNFAQLANTEALKPGGTHLPDSFSPEATPVSTHDNRGPDSDINFFGTNIGLVQEYSSDSATDAIGSESEDEENGAVQAGDVQSAAYVMSLEQENESLKQLNLNLQEEIWVLKQQLEEQQQRQSAQGISPEPSHDGGKGGPEEEGLS